MMPQMNLALGISARKIKIDRTNRQKETVTNGIQLGRSGSESQSRCSSKIC